MTRHTLILNSTDLRDLKKAVTVLSFQEPSRKIKVRYLPHKKKMITIVRGPHVHKDSREQWKYTEYRRALSWESEEISMSWQHWKLRNVSLRYVLEVTTGWHSSQTSSQKKTPLLTNQEYRLFTNPKRFPPSPNNEAYRQHRARVYEKKQKRSRTSS